MSDDTGARIDAYIGELFLPDDPSLRDALASMDDAGLPTIQVPAALGRLLGILVRAIGARRVLEIGTLGGYSAIWMARALPAGGRLISLEAEPRHAEVARANLAQAGLDDRAEVRLGPALETLPQLAAAGAGPFDLVFIDADKTGYDAYYERCLLLLRPGGLMAIDNTLWGGSVARPAQDEDTGALQRLNEKIHADARVDMSLLPIGDGLTLVRKR